MTTIYGADGEGLSSIMPLGAGLSSIIPLAAGLGLCSIIPLAAGLGLSSIIPLGAGLFAGADVAPAGVVHAAAPTAAIIASGSSHRPLDRLERRMLASLATEAGRRSRSPLEMTGE